MECQIVATMFAVRYNVSIDTSCGLMYDCFMRPRLLQWSGRPGLGLYI